MPLFMTLHHHGLQMKSLHEIPCSTRTSRCAVPCPQRGGSCKHRVAAASSKNGTGRTDSLTDPAVKLVNGAVTEGPDLSVTVNGLKLPNPFVIGSGPPGTNYAVMKKAFEEGWGAVICKTLSLDSAKVRQATGAAAERCVAGASAGAVGWACMLINRLFICTAVGGALSASVSSTQAFLSSIHGATRSCWCCWYIVLQSNSPEWCVHAPCIDCCTACCR